MTDQRRIETLRENILRQVAEYYALVHGDRKEDFEPGRDLVHYGGRVFDENELLNLTDATLEFWLTSGRYTARFEERLAAFLDVKTAMFVNSGSSANLLAFMALTCGELGKRAIRRGDEVITVAAAFPTTVAPIVQFGAVPVFVDVSLPSYNIDVTQLEHAVSTKTKAVVLAHTLGNPFPVEEVVRFCRERDLWLIEDNCDALGSMYDGRYTGSFGDIGTSSFYPAHHITTGEGGAVYTSDPLLARILASLRDWGRDCQCPSGRDNRCGKRFTGRFGKLPPGYDHKYVYSHFGYNLKGTDMQTSVGCAQLEKLPRFIEARKENWRYLRDTLAPLSDRFILPEPEPRSDPSWFGFALTVRKEAPFSRGEIVEYLESKRIQTRMLFAGNLVKHPCFDGIRDDAWRQVGTLEGTDRVLNDTFWLGVYPGMTRKRLDYMADCLGEKRPGFSRTR